MQARRRVFDAHFHTGYLPGAEPLAFDAFMREYGVVVQEIVFEDDLQQRAAGHHEVVEQADFVGDVRPVGALSTVL